MKATKISLSLAALFFVGALALTSCKKKTPEPVPVPEPEDTEQTSASDNNLSENAVSDIEAMGSQASENDALLTYRSSEAGQTGVIEMAPCAVVTTSIVAGVRSQTVDFGSNCLGADGRTRSGKLIYVSSGGFYRNPGYVLTVTSQNYVVDGHTITINNKTITNTTPAIPPGVNPGKNLTWAITATITIQKAGGGTITWNCNRTKELTNTSDTLCYRGQNKAIVWNKAKIKLNGSAGGSNASNESYSVVATNLVRDFNCAPDANRPHRHPFIGGTILYTPAKRLPRLIDYGNGTDCDFNATVTINGKAYPFTLN